MYYVRLIDPLIPEKSIIPVKEDHPDSWGDYTIAHALMYDSPSDLIRPRDLNANVYLKEEATMSLPTIELEEQFVEDISEFSIKRSFEDIVFFENLEFSYDSLAYAFYNWVGVNNDIPLYLNTDNSEFTGEYLIYLDSKEKLYKYKITPPFSKEKPQQSKPQKGLNMKNDIKTTAAELVNQNKSNATAVARVTAGKAINKKLVSLIKPKLPFPVRSFADHELAPLFIANVVSFAIKNYTDSQKANEAADMMLEASAFQTAEAFNIDDLIEDLLDGIKLPGDEEVSFDISTAKMSELREYAKSNNIDLVDPEGNAIKGIDNIRAFLCG